MCVTASRYIGNGRTFERRFSCSTGIVVTALARPEWVVEIEATAVIAT